MYVIEHVKTSISKSGLWRFWERTSETSRATVGLLAKLVPLKKIAYVPPVFRGAMVGWYLLIPSGKRHTASPSSRACAHGQNLVVGRYDRGESGKRRVHWRTRPARRVHTNALTQ